MPLPESSVTAVTYQSYHQRFWKPNDHVSVSDSVHHGKRGILLEIELENRSATVQLLEGGECITPLSKLCRSHSVGDVVWVIEDPFSDTQSIHHQFIGHFGMVSYIEFAMEEITVTESDGNCYDFSFLSLHHSSHDSLSRWTNFAPSLEDALRLNPASITSRRAWLYFFSLTDVLLVHAQFAAQPTSLLSHGPLTIYIRLSFSATNTAWSMRRVSMYLYDDTSCTFL